MICKNIKSSCTLPTLLESPSNRTPFCFPSAHGHRRPGGRRVHGSARLPGQAGPRPDRRLREGLPAAHEVRPPERARHHRPGGQDQRRDGQEDEEDRLRLPRLVHRLNLKLHFKQIECKKIDFLGCTCHLEGYPRGSFLSPMRVHDCRLLISFLLRLLL